jgi:hypothetical protein
VRPLHLSGHCFLQLTSSVLSKLPKRVKQAIDAGESIPQPKHLKHKGRAPAQKKKADKEAAAHLAALDAPKPVLHVVNAGRRHRWRGSGGEYFSDSLLG